MVARRRLALLDRRVLVVIAVISITDRGDRRHVPARRRRHPEYGRDELAVARSGAGRLGARRAGRGPGGGPGAVRRVLPRRLAPARLRRGHRRGRGARRGRPPGCGRSPVRPGPASPTAPAGSHANVASFQRLLRPLTDKLGERSARADRRRVTRRVAGAEVGMLLGWMSTRVLGQYDLLVIDDEDSARRPGPRVLRRPQRARPREALRLPAQRVPAVAGAPRGHPPGAVHRRAVAARALPRPRAADARLGRSRPDAVPRRHRARASTSCATGASRSTTAASPRCSPPPSSARCSTRSAG